MATNADVEAEIARRLPEILQRLGLTAKPFQCEVRLYRRDRNARYDADFEWNWDPEHDMISIRAWPVTEAKESGTSGAEPDRNGVEDSGASDFQPLPIRGEPLSATVLTTRR